MSSALPSRRVRRVSVIEVRYWQASTWSWDTYRSRISISSVCYYILTELVSTGLITPVLL